MTMPTFHATFQREPDGRWIAEIPAVPGVFASGRTIDEARRALWEALAVFVEHADTARIVEEISW